MAQLTESGDAVTPVDIEAHAAVGQVEDKPSHSAPGPVAEPGSSAAREPIQEKSGHNAPVPALESGEASEAVATSGGRKKSLSFYLAYLSLLLMVLIVSIDATALAVAIPAITSELQGTSLEAFWASLSFMLAVVVVQPIYTSVSDVLGRKIPMYAGFFLFGVGSIIFAVAPSMPIVILGRVIQGLGGGGLDVLNEVVIADITTLKERPLYLGFMAVPMAVGSILGPLIGALFSEFVTWRWIGWINLPLIAVSLVLAVFFLRLKPIEQSFMSRLASLDWIGILLFTVGSTTFALPLSWAGAMYPWSSWRTILPLIVGLLVLLGFGFYEARPQNPVMPYRIFSSRTAQVTLIGAFMHGMVMYTLLLYVPLFFQAVYLRTPLRSAIDMLPLLVVVMFFSGAGAAAVDYIRRYRIEIWLGWIFLVLGTGLFGLWDRNSSMAERAGFQAVVSIGLGTVFTVPPMAMQAATPNASDHGLAVGILVSFRLFGALAGLAVGATTFSSVFANSISSLGPLPASIAILKNSEEAVGFISNLRQVDLPVEILDAVIEAYRKAMQSIFFILTGFGGLGFVTSLFMEELSLETEELGRQQFETSPDGQT